VYDIYENLSTNCRRKQKEMRKANALPLKGRKDVLVNGTNKDSRAGKGRKVSWTVRGKLQRSRESNVDDLEETFREERYPNKIKERETEEQVKGGPTERGGGDYSASKCRGTFTGLGRL